MAPVKRKAPDNRKVSKKIKFYTTLTGYDPNYPIGYFTENYFQDVGFNTYLMNRDNFRTTWYRTFKNNGFLHWYVGKDEVVSVPRRRGGTVEEIRRDAIAHDSMLLGEQTYTFPEVDTDAWCTLYSLYNYIKKDYVSMLYGITLFDLDRLTPEEADYVLKLADGEVESRGASYDKKLRKRILVVRRTNQRHILNFLYLLGRNKRFLEALFNYDKWKPYYSTQKLRDGTMKDWYTALDLVKEEFNKKSTK